MKLPAFNRRLPLIQAKNRSTIQRRLYRRSSLPSVYEPNAARADKPRLNRARAPTSDQLMRLAPPVTWQATEPCAVQKADPHGRFPIFFDVRLQRRPRGFCPGRCRGRGMMRTRRLRELPDVDEVVAPCDQSGTSPAPTR